MLTTRALQQERMKLKRQRLGLQEAESKDKGKGRGRYSVSPFGSLSHSVACRSQKIWQ